MHICVNDLTTIGSENGVSPGRRLVGAWSALNQCWNIVNWTPTNKLQWNIDRNSWIYIQENPFENVVCEIASILSRLQCVKKKNVLTRHLIGWQLCCQQIGSQDWKFGLTIVDFNIKIVDYPGPRTSQNNRINSVRSNIDYHQYS